VDAQTVLNSQKDIMAIYNKIPGSRNIDCLSTSGIRSLTRENFNSYKSKIKNIFINSFGLAVYEKIGIVSVGRKPDTRFGVKIDKSKIILIGMKFQH
jgi:CRISPR-associated protein Csx14